MLRCATLRSAIRISLRKTLRNKPCNPSCVSSNPSNLGFAISRRVKRAIFEWAERETRARVFEGETLDFESPQDSVERLALLRHFLDRAVRRGVLSDDELNLLVQFKLENGLENGTPENSSNAHRQRLKRLLSKLRRIADGQGTCRRRKRA